MSLKELRPNALLSFVLGIVYAAFYDYIVRDYIFSVFDYYVSYSYTPMGPSDSMIYLLLCAAPLLLYQGLGHFSGAISFILYLLAYVPMMNTLFVAGYPQHLSQPYVAVLFVSMSLIFLTDGIVLGKKLILGKRKRLPFKYLEIITLILMGIVLVMHRGQLHFVNIMSESALMYELREETFEEMRGGLALYLLGWLKQVFLPILMVAYLHSKQYLKYALAFGGIILMFMLDMQKLTIIMPFVITAFYFIYKSHSRFFLKNFHIILTLAMVVFPFLCNTFRDDPLVAGIAFILIFRTQCIEGVEWNTYFRFFELNPGHPYTWYSHIGIVRKVFGGYPYKGALGRVVTNGGSNANGVFWLMDGLAAGGPVGVLLSTLFFIIFKSLFCSIDFKVNKGMSLCVLLFAIASMVNLSLFTAILSCGFLVFYLVVMFFDLDILGV